MARCVAAIKERKKMGAPIVLPFPDLLPEFIFLPPAFSGLAAFMDPTLAQQGVGQNALPFALRHVYYLIV